MDEADVAWRFTEAFLNEAIKKMRPKPGSSRKRCLECGERIPQARREAVKGCQYCVDCQRELEAEK